MEGPPSVVTGQVRRAVLANDGTGKEPAVWFSTTTGALNGALPGENLDGETEGRIFVIIVRGDFVVRFARGPQGAAPPHGHVLLLAFDQVSAERVPAYLLLYQDPDVAMLGAPHPLTY